MGVGVRRVTALIALAVLAQFPATAQSVRSIVVPGGDMATLAPPTVPADYIRREAMLPMRDGVKLYTVMMIPKGAANAPIILTRTPYDATARAMRSQSRKLINASQRSEEQFVRAGYIRVWQDVRGKYKSEGEYVMMRPPVGPLNDTGVDNATDAYDTIAWLTNPANLPESNGRVGMVGSSYEGHMVAMALLRPHPALKAAVAESPMIDQWRDDWFHNGAFHNIYLDYFAMQTGAKGALARPPHHGYDDYDNFLRAGSTHDWAVKHGLDQMPVYKRLEEHPAYDEVWQEQALDRLLAANPSDVPTIWEAGLWDQEEIHGAVLAWEALKAAGKVGNNHLILGPWRHSQVNREGRRTGAFAWNGDTVRQYWDEMVMPLFRERLEDGPKANLPSAILYNTAEDRWERFARWPLACERDCPAPLTPLNLAGEGGLSFAQGARGEDSYVSDPAKPVPFMPRPYDMDEFAEPWTTWRLSDQRHVDKRPDVMSYETEPLTEPVRVSGVPIAELFARTTGTDGDFVVKLIDVFPPENANDPPMGGYQLPISIEILRGRYRDDPSRPSAIPANVVQRYRFRMPVVNHVFRPGHRIMVQIQSSLFPLYDRNPQTFVPNIFLARKQDYRAATITLERGGSEGSRVWLPVLPIDGSARAGKR